MSDMTPERIAELRRIGQAATPGEWTCYERGHKLLGYDIDEVPAGGRGAFEREEDAEFCCTARNTWDALLDALAELQTIKDETVEYIHDGGDFNWTMAIIDIRHWREEIERLTQENAEHRRELGRLRTLLAKF
jgi:hypothetical protein